MATIPKTFKLLCLDSLNNLITLQEYFYNKFEIRNKNILFLTPYFKKYLTANAKIFPFSVCF